MKYFRRILLLAISAALCITACLSTRYGGRSGVLFIRNAFGESAEGESGAEYSINYQLNGGRFTAAVADRFTAEDEVLLPASAVVQKEGFVFSGWYLDAACTEPRCSMLPKGTAADCTLYAGYVPYAKTIRSVEELLAFAEAVNGGDSMEGKGILLDADLDLSGVEFSGIGLTFDTPFAGVFDGCGHTVSGISIQGQPIAGLFGVLAESGCVMNLIAEGEVSGKVAGGIVGNNVGGLVHSCSFRGTVTADSATELRVITQNVRNENASDVHGVVDRHAILTGVLRERDPDIIGLQEVDAAWQTYLPNDLPEYAYVLKYRGKGGNATIDKESTPIFYKKDKFTLLDSGHFWLKNSPNFIGTCFDDGYNRICSWVKLQVKETGEVVYFFNTHFPLTQTARDGALGILQQMVAEIADHGATYLISADWNFNSKNSTYKTLAGWAEDVAISAEVDATNLSPTFNNFKIKPSTRIDMIFARYNTVTVPYHEVMLDTWIDADGIEWPPSDHYGVFCRLVLQNAAGGIAGNNEGDLIACISEASASGGSFSGSLCGKNLGFCASLAAAGEAIGVNHGLSSYAITDPASLNAASAAPLWSADGKALQFENPYYYTVSFCRGETPLSVQSVFCGDDAAPPAVEAEEGMVFAGWSGAYKRVLGTLTLQAQFCEKGRVSVSFASEGDNASFTVNGNAPETVDAKIGDVLRLSAGEGFLYWKDENQRIVSQSPRYDYPVTHNAALTAVFKTESRVTVTFIDADHTVLKTHLIRSGRNALPPISPKYEGMTFSEWTPSYKALTEDTVIRAVYLEERSPAVSDAPLSVRRVGDTWQLTRCIEGDYTVLGSGVLLCDPDYILPLPENADGTTVTCIADPTLTRRSRLTVSSTARCARAYAILLNEETGEIETVFSAVAVNEE